LTHNTGNAEWFHIAVTSAVSSGRATKLYINSVEQDTDTKGTVDSLSDVKDRYFFYLGNDTNDNTLTGNIWEFKLWATAYTA
jgi:hypothetical protein